MQRQFTTFFLGENLFGIDVLLVREINRHLDITNVTPAPDFVVGLMNLRGQIVAVTDLGIRLGLEKRVIGKETCCIVLKTEADLATLRSEGMVSEATSKDTIGLIVDRISDMILVDESDIEPPPANLGGVDGRYLGGVIKQEGNLVALLRIEEILKLETA